MYKLLIPLFALALLVGCTPQKKNTPPATPPAMEDESSSQPTAMDAFNGQMLSGPYDVVLKTSMGDIALTLDADKAPKTVTNFIVLAQMGYYDGLTFHRVIPDFMIQGGDPNGNGTGGESIYGEKFEDEENDLTMDRGVIAMANAGPDTNGSQFFIVQAAEGTPWLQGKHTIFGKVTKGMEIVDAIVNVEADPSNNMPTEPVTFMVEVLE